MLTTSVDGLWVLQALTGIELVAPEMALRPLLPSVETRQLALRHPVAEELRSAGVITDCDTVDEAVVEWLTVLSRRDVAILFQMHSADSAQYVKRVLLVRLAHWWVTLERDGVIMKLSGAGIATTEPSAALLISAQVEQICGSSRYATVSPVTLDADELLANVHDRDSLELFLNAKKLNPHQLSALICATDPSRSKQISIIAIQSTISGSNNGSSISDGLVTVIDSPAGRLVAEHVTRDRRKWIVISPGSTTQTASAIRDMMRRLPAKHDWYSHRKAV